MIKPEKDELKHERFKLLNYIQKILELPMIILGFVWLLLLVIELIWGLTSILEMVSVGIWVIFILDFLLRFTLAPDKIKFLKKNVLTAISLFVPALRVFRLARLTRILRTVRAARGLRLVKVLGSLNRGMRSLSASLGRRQFGYVLAFTLLVIVVGAAGMYTFENQEPNGLISYGEALYWTAMLLTSLGSEYWPRTAEGRTLCFLLGLYGFTVFGYFTASLATFFVGRDAENDEAELAGSKQIIALQQDITLLRAELQQLTAALNKPTDLPNNSSKELPG